MVVEKFLEYGEIRGKLSLNPEQAREMLGYEMKPGAVGVVLQMRGDKQVVFSQMPYKRHKRTKLEKASLIRMKTMGSISREHFNELIKPIWNPAAKERNYLAGHQLFTALNFRRIGPELKWENMLLTPDTSQPPEFSMEHCPLQNILIIKLSESAVKRAVEHNMSPKLAMLRMKTVKLHMLEPVDKPELRSMGFKKLPAGRLYFKLPVKVVGNGMKKDKQVVIFMYLRDETGYSASAALNLHRCEKYTTVCYMKKKVFYCPYKMGH